MAVASIELRDLECPKCQQVFLESDFIYCPYCEDDEVLHNAVLVPKGPDPAELAVFDETQIWLIASQLGDAILQEIQKPIDRPSGNCFHEYGYYRGLAMLIASTFDLPEIPPYHLEYRVDDFRQLCCYILWAKDHKEHLQID